VSTGGGKEAAWNPSGRELFYVDIGGMLTAVPVSLRGSTVETGQARRLFPAPFGVFHRNYEVSADGQRFLIAAPATPGGSAITMVTNRQTGLPNR
jgi:hypothetical protein